MLDDGAPALEVGFAIDTDGAFGSLIALDEQIDTSVAKAVQEFDRVKRASGNMINLGGSSLPLKKLSDEATTAGRAIKREMDRANAAGEGLSRQLERQVSTFGMSRAAAAALRAEQSGLTELADRLRTQEAALTALHTQAAAATLSEAAAAKRLADEHARLAATVQASHAAEVADAATLERLRASTDPLYASTQRLNAEIAESTRLHLAGVSGADEYARQQTVLQGRMRELGSSHDAVAGSVKRNGHALTQLSFQLNDVATMAASGAHPMQIVATQAGQVFQVFQQAEGGAKGLGKELGGLALRFSPIAIGAGVVGTMLYSLNQGMQNDAATKKFVAGLGLTEKELKKLGNTSVTVGDMITGFATTLGFKFDGLGSMIKGWVTDFGGFFVDVFKGVAASVYGLMVGTAATIVNTWRQIPAALGEFAVAAVNSSAAAIEALINKSIDGINLLARGANSVLGVELLGQIEHVAIPRLENKFNGTIKSMGRTAKASFDGATKQALDAMDAFGASVTSNSQAARNKRLLDDANKLKADRTPKKNAGDKHAEQLGRENEAIEAQIRNLYKLADAYGVSGAAALIAEARVKAESDAIKKRGDIELFVNRQVALAIAQRVSDGAKEAAAMRDKAQAQTSVNALVDAGLVPAERAAELVQERIADLPMLAAIEAAQQRGLAAEATKATAALEKQREARKDLRVAEEFAAFQVDEAAANKRFAELAEEARLIDATDAARVHALATLKATQEAQVKYAASPDLQANYIKMQVGLADKAQANVEAQARFNSQLEITAELADSLGESLANAFGRVGGAIGQAVKILGTYGVRQDDIAKRVKAGTLEQADATKLTANLQMEGMLGLTSAAKGLFKEHSKGYQAMAAAEKALTLIQLARTAVDVAGGAARMFATLGPFAFPAVAAMVGVMASLGFGGGGVSSSYQVKANEGTGTVFGDRDAKSESLKNSLEALRQVDTLTNTYARQMMASLKSIDSQIGGVTNLVLRAGNIDASSNVQEGFKTSLGAQMGVFGPLGALIGKIPVIGKLLKSLFGTTTSVVGNGLYGGAQDLGSILNGGFDASYYSDVQKKKKLFGITTGTSYYTQYSGADAGLEQQFTLILRSFNDAILASAGPLGASTAEITQRLQGFIVNIGKIDLKDLTGEQIQEKLEAVFGAAADNMANTAFPGITRFQKVGEGAFETLVRVASTVEAVTNELSMLGTAAASLSIDAKMGLIDRFESVDAFSSSIEAYFAAFYTPAEQTAAKTAQLGRVFTSLGLAMPGSMAAYRALVDAQNLTTTAGQQTYALLVQLAPAFAELATAMTGTKSAADILTERQDLERQLLELKGDTAALRALDLAKVDASNRSLQEQVYAFQDAKKAADAAEQLKNAWKSIGDTIMDEVKRIRGITGTGDSSFAGLMGQFNAATASARGGDQEAAKSLPGLSQALLNAAALVATSRQELARVQAQTAASLEATYGAIAAISGSSNSASTTLENAATAAQASAAPTAANTDASELRSIREELAALRRENNAGHAATAGNTGRIASKLKDVTDQSGGDAIAVVSAAA